MNTEEQNKVNNFLEIYANAFNGMVHKAISQGFELTEKQAPSMIGFDTERLMKMMSPYNTVDVKTIMGNHVSLMQQHMQLWENTSKAMFGLDKLAPTVIEDADDKRFADPQWNENPFYSYIKQAYLLNSKMLTNVVDNISFKDTKQADQAKFYTRQYISSAAPTNLALSNPEVCRDILESGGKNLVRGMENFIKDMQQSPLEALKITQSDPDAFTLGENLATTPGQVVFQNEMLQLIQYEATSKQVYKTPLLLIPPFINKYYIMDLNEKKSLVKWLVSQGFTVFMVSWVNPDVSMATTRFEDYVVKGIGEAIDAIEEITGSKEINATGYCVGGTLLSVVQAWLRAKGDNRLRSCTFFTTLVDFSEPGEINAYLSLDLLTLLEQNSKMKGIFDGRILAMSFNLLRENNLFWSYFINNYLKGKDPVAFDILYWNSDSTNIPADTFGYYVRKMYVENKLIEADGIKIGDVGIDLGNIDSPSYVLAALADHIVPWQASFNGSRNFSGPVRFVLGASGHVAGVINPPEPGKYPHWINEKPAESAEAWQQDASEVQGSWWLDWKAWLEPQSGAKIAARKVGSHKDYPALEAAPGSYVKVRI